MKRPRAHFLELEGSPKAIDGVAKQAGLRFSRLFSPDLLEPFYAEKLPETRRRSEEHGVR